jgi:carbon-monoxide dehydrogenase small subunit
VNPIVTPLAEATIELTVNGQQVTRTVPVRRTLADFLRDDLELTGTHLGCEHGVCGACTVLIDGRPSRSCILLAVQADGSAVTTVEGITPSEGLNPLQQAFKDHHGLQCGFCTPGFLMTLTGSEPDEYPDDGAIRELLSGNLCRCTGYQKIVEAVRDAWGRDGL